MRIVAWNVNHGGTNISWKTRRDVLRIIEQLQPDVLSLNEYLHGNAGEGFREGFVRELADLGLEQREVSQQVGKGNNQLLIASRHGLKRGELSPPALEDEGQSKSNFLHVKLPTENIEVVGFRVAYGKRARPYPEWRKTYWLQLIETIQQTRDRRIVYTGDFNTDPRDSTRAESKYLAPLWRSLEDQGWFLPNFGANDWSFAKQMRETTVTKKLDHVLSSPRLPKPIVEYVNVDLQNAAGQQISDHRPLLVTI